MNPIEHSPGLVVNIATPELKLSDFKLIAFDMDSTLINIECVDEIAAAAGRKEEVAAITEAAMRGEITDFKDSLRRRVALLQGVSVASMEAVYRERLQLNPGAAELVRACKDAGLKVLLEVAELIGIAAEQTIAVGDGANDLPMMGAAGVAVAFHAKPAVQAQAHISITAGGLDRALAVLRP